MPIQIGSVGIPSRMIVRLQAEYAQGQCKPLEWLLNKAMDVEIIGGKRVNDLIADLYQSENDAANSRSVRRFLADFANQHLLKIRKDMHNEVRRRYSEPAGLQEIEQAFLFLVNFIERSDLPADVQKKAEGMYNEIKQLLEEIERAK